MTSLRATEMTQADLPFLMDLWRRPEVMRYADEFPRMRGWRKSDDLQAAWRAYAEKRAAFGPTYSQLILRLSDGTPSDGSPSDGTPSDGTPIGESFCAALAEGATFGKWSKPARAITLLGDIKLCPEHWGRGLGTKGMSLVVRHRFDETACALFCVPPHRRNIAAIRVYEKTGFEMFTGMRSHRNHRMMEMTRARYREIYG